MKFYVEILGLVEEAATEDQAHECFMRGNYTPLRNAIYNERDHARHFAELEARLPENGRVRPFEEYRRPIAYPSQEALQGLRDALQNIENSSARAWLEQLLHDQKL